MSFLTANFILGMLLQAIVLVSSFLILYNCTDYEEKENAFYDLNGVVLSRFALKLPLCCDRGCSGKFFLTGLQ